MNKTKAITIGFGVLLGVALLSGTIKRGKKMNERTIERIKNFIRRTYNVDSSKPTIIGIRGASLDSDGNLFGNGNKTDEWNDLVVLIQGSFGSAYEASIDPGKHWLENPMNANGTARIEPGLYKYKRGLHDGKPAFISASPIRVRRDGNKDKIFDSKDKVFSDTPNNRFGINIHASYGGSKVNRNSAGCTVINAGWNSPIWTDFRDRLYSSKETEFVYIVGNVGDFI